MKKMAIIFVNGAEKDPSVLISACSKACAAAYSRTLSRFGKKEADFDITTVHVLDIQTLLAIRYNVDKYGINHFFETNDEKNPDPMKSVLAVGPEEPEKLNKMSSGLRLF